MGGASTEALVVERSALSRWRVDGSDAGALWTVIARLIDYLLLRRQDPGLSRWFTGGRRSSLGSTSRASGCFPIHSRSSRIRSASVSGTCHRSEARPSRAWLWAPSQVPAGIQFVSRRRVGSRVACSPPPARHTIKASAGPTVAAGYPPPRDQPLPYPDQEGTARRR
jgi:hypothetical protein